MIIEDESQAHENSNEDTTEDCNTSLGESIHEVTQNEAFSMPTINYICSKYKTIRDESKHFKLRNDLIEHLWQLKLKRD